MRLKLVVVTNIGSFDNISARAQRWALINLEALLKEKTDGELHVLFTLTLSQWLWPATRFLGTSLLIISLNRKLHYIEDEVGASWFMMVSLHSNQPSW